MRSMTAILAVLTPCAFLRAQAALSEPAEFPAVRPGPSTVHVGQNCFHLASGMITPGDVDWVRVVIPRASTLTVVDVDFPTGTGASGLLAMRVGGSSAYNMSDGNGTRDNHCGLGAGSIPLGSPLDSVANLGATPLNSTIDVGVTGASDAGFVGNHSQSFVYSIWLYVLPVNCTSDAVCSDGIACTIDTCNPSTGVCSNLPDDAACDDGLLCSGEEACVPGAGCRVVNPADCDDGVDCTWDHCNPLADACVSAPNDDACDDGTFCNGYEVCDAALGCIDGDAPDCDDGVGCTVDHCDAELDACTNEPVDSECDNGRFCDGAESCDAEVGCVSGDAPACDDAVDCTIDRCDRVSDACAHDPSDAVCDDGTFCNGFESCDAAIGCVSGDPPDCDDGIDCTTDFCDAAVDDCNSSAVDGACDDGEFCNGAEACDPAIGCVDGAAPCAAGETCDGDAEQCVPAGPGLDVRPRSCPNKMHGKGNGEIQVALTGSPNFDVEQVVIESLMLSRQDGVGMGVPPQAGSPITMHDVTGYNGGEPCVCTTRGSDGIVDLVLYFGIGELRAAFGLINVPHGGSLQLRITGTTVNGASFEATDCVLVIQRSQ